MSQCLWTYTDGYPDIWDIFYSDNSHTANIRTLDDLQIYLPLFVGMPWSQKSHDWMVLKDYNSMRDVPYLDWPQLCLPRLIAQCIDCYSVYKNQGGKALTSLWQHFTFKRESEECICTRQLSATFLSPGREVFSATREAQVSSSRDSKQDWAHSTTQQAVHTGLPDPALPWSSSS